jgi:hypothetical protein
MGWSSLLLVAVAAAAARAQVCFKLPYLLHSNSFLPPTPTLQKKPQTTHSSSPFPPPSPRSTTTPPITNASLSGQPPRE